MENPYVDPLPFNDATDWAQPDPAPLSPTSLTPTPYSPVPSLPPVPELPPTHTFGNLLAGPSLTDVNFSGYPLGLADPFPETPPSPDPLPAGENAGGLHLSLAPAAGSPQSDALPRLSIESLTDPSLHTPTQNGVHPPEDPLRSDDPRSILGDALQYLRRGG